jgi:hypothetical protein
MPARSRWSPQGEGSRFYTTLAMNIRRPMLPGMRDVAFFAAFAIYAWAGIDTRLIYHWQGPVFTTIPGFLGEFLKYPGGPADYLQGLIAQAYAWQLWGAIALTAQVAAVAALTQVYFATLARGELAGPVVGALRLVPAVVLLYHLNLYYDRTPIMLSLLLGLALAILLVHLSRRWRSEWALLGASVAMLGAAYYLAGMTIVFFAPAAAMALSARRRRPPLWIVPLLLAVGLPAAVEGLRLLYVPASAREWFLDSDVRREIVYWGLYLFYAGSAAFILWRRPVPVPPAPKTLSGNDQFNRRQPLPHGRGSASTSEPRQLEGEKKPVGRRKRLPHKSASRCAPTWDRRFRLSTQRTQRFFLTFLGSGWYSCFGTTHKRRLPELLATAVVFLTLAAVAAASYRLNSRDRCLTAMDYDSLHEDWSAVIDAARRLPGDDFNSLTRYQVNLALHETNRLGDDMFRFPQKGPMLLDLRADQFLPYMIRITDMCLRLGRINEAERFGSEAMILRQRDPRVYRQMASVDLVKGQTAAARKFLNVLTYDLGSGGWARERLRELDRDPQLAGDGQIQLLRRRMLHNDDAIAVWQRPDKPSADLERLLLDQLEQDPGNRMAFEFLMGNYLLARDMVAVHALMPRMAGMTGPAYVEPGGKRRTPRHYQEAMALHAGVTGQAVHMEGVEIEAGTLARMEAFKRTVSQVFTKEAAMHAAWDDFRDTYFFYFAFGPGDYR